MFENLDDPWFQRRFLNVAVGSSGGFGSAAHAPAHANGAACSGSSQRPAPSGQSLELFRARRRACPGDAHWLPYPDKDELSWRLLAMGAIAPRDVCLGVDRLERIAARMADASPWAIGHGASIVSAALPAGSATPDRCLVGTEVARRSDACSRRYRDYRRNIRSSVSEANDILAGAAHPHDLPAIAEAAPGRFVEAIWPHFCETPETVAAEAHPFVVGYRDVIR